MVYNAYRFVKFSNKIHTMIINGGIMLDLTGIIEVDLHGMRAEEAKKKIDKMLDFAGSGVYRIRCIHGFHGGTRLKDMIYEEYSYGREPRVLKIVPGNNSGITELVLKDYY